MSEKYVNHQLEQLEEWMHPAQREILKQRFGRVTLLSLIQNSGVQLDDITDTISKKVVGYSTAEMTFPKKCEVIWVQTEDVYNPETMLYKTRFTYHIRVPKICIPLYVSAIRSVLNVPITAYGDCFYIQTGEYRVRIGYGQFFRSESTIILDGIVDSIKNTIEFRSKDDPSLDNFEDAINKVVNSPEYHLLLKYLEDA